MKPMADLYRPPVLERQDNALGYFPPRARYSSALLMSAVSLLETHPQA